MQGFRQEIPWQSWVFQHSSRLPAGSQGTATGVGDCTLCGVGDIRLSFAGARKMKGTVSFPPPSPAPAFTSPTGEEIEIASNQPEASAPRRDPSQAQQITASLNPASHLPEEETENQPHRRPGQ
ncbi:Serine/Threonine-Protein Phosphatase 4 Regulatory Subunit 4 [Manis pentadactyla]|nr:Serine/Threonine-Protein Phosphatase 4 Regulatory Subunit 4 [Manis pentadactyla]